jgi:streptogramin lyase
VVVPDVPKGLAVGEGFAWITMESGTTRISRTTLYQIDPATNQLKPWTEMSYGSTVVVGGGFVWVASVGEVHRVDPSIALHLSVQLKKVFDVVALAVGQGEAEGVWTANRTTSTVSRIAFDGSLTGTYPVPSRPDAIAVGAGAVWIANRASDVLYRLDPAAGSVVQKIEVPDGPGAIAVASESVWVCAANAGVVARIDTSTNRVTDRLEVDGAPLSIVADSNGDLWVGVGPRVPV